MKENYPIVDSVEKLEAALARVREAQRKFATYTQEQVDKIFKAAAIAANGLEGFRRDTTWSSMAESIVGPDGNPDSLQYIPYGEGAVFELEKTIYVGRSGVVQNVMECRAPYSAYLTGLSEREIYNLTDAAEKQSRYPGLKIGDLTTPNNNAGNWE